MVCPALKEIVEEPRDTICDNLDTLLREVEIERVRDLQEESSQSVVCSLPRIGSEKWRRLNGIYWMHLGPGRREQRATRSRPYISKTIGCCGAVGEFSMHNQVAVQLCYCDVSLRCCGAVVLCSGLGLSK